MMVFSLALILLVSIAFAQFPPMNINCTQTPSYNDYGGYCKCYEERCWYEQFHSLRRVLQATAPVDVDCHLDPDYEDANGKCYCPANLADDICWFVEKIPEEPLDPVDCFKFPDYEDYGGKCWCYMERCWYEYFHDRRRVSSLNSVVSQRIGGGSNLN